MGEPASSEDAGHIVGLFPELTGLGGVQEASLQTLGALQNVLARRDRFGTYLGLNDPLGLQTVQTAGHSVRFRGFNRAKVRFVLQLLWLAKKQPRIVVAAHPNLAVPALWMKRFSPSVKTVVICHGVEVWAPLPLRRKKALLAADMVIAPSNYTAEKLNTVQGVDKKKIRLLPWPVNAEMLQVSDEPSTLRLPEGFPEGRVILTVGRWAASERYKGADDLIRAMVQLLATFPGLRLVAIGGGDDLPRLRTIAKELGVNVSIIFLEKISREQLAACYAHAEIFALPSTGEGFGIVFLEAMAFGLPVVGAAAGGVPDIVKDGVNGFLVPGKNVGGLVLALDRLLRDRPLASAMGRRGAETIRQKYQFHQFETSLENILIECGLD